MPAHSGREEEGGGRGLRDLILDRDHMMAQLSKLFVQNKGPFLEPRVPGSVYYLSKAYERNARREANAKQMLRHKGKHVSGEVRLQRARRAAFRQPRSRRELERLTSSQSADEIKQLHSNKVLNQYLSAGLPGKARPLTAASTLPAASETSVNTRQQAPGDEIFRLTELGSESGEAMSDSEFVPRPADVDEDGQIHLAPGDISRHRGFQRAVVTMGSRQQQRHAGRSAVVCAMVERQVQQQSALSQTRLRPQSAPVWGQQHSQDDTEDDQRVDSFDWETSESSLSNLEQRIRTFLDQGEKDLGKRANNAIHDMRRFKIQVRESASWQV